MDKDTLDKLLKNTDRDELVMLISVLSSYSRSGEQWLMDWLERNAAGNAVLLAETKILVQWDTAVDIIGDAEYGRNYRENEIFVSLQIIADICSETDLPWDFRSGVLMQMVQVIREGSDYADSVAETAYALCRTDEEKLYYAHMLPENDPNISKAAIQIYRECGDEENYLRLRTMHLQYGDEYAEIAEFYRSRGEYTKAASVAEKGVRECSGAAEKLYEWIAAFYMERGEKEKLRAVYDTAVRRKNDVFAIAEIMYRYSSTYEEKREYVMQAFRECSFYDCRHWYDECCKVLNEADYKRREELLHDILRNKNYDAYLELRIEEGGTDEVLRALQKAYRSVFRNTDKEHQLTAKIADIYPEEVCDMYLSECTRLCSTSNSKHYQWTVDILCQIRDILLRNNLDRKWQEVFSSFRVQNKRKTTLIKMISTDKRLNENARKPVQQTML